ncbi:MAG TPA: Ni/Fe-hydrogenase, b-type cytochrome subunit [Acidobacteriota bacterium]|nr:Ni/Fe-hydrogenase, b-type cytochrome subunit [Acidobacteriota bacterium]
MATTHRVYIWELPVRITHWVNAITIVILSVTGYYIGSPFFDSPNDDSLLPMALMRFIHFVAAYAFTASVLFRIYWWFAGNEYARLNQFIPTSMGRVQNAVQTGLFYGFLEDHIPHSPGHTGMAGIAYFFLFMMFLFLIFSGFAMLHLANGGGLIYTIGGGWMLSVMNAGTLRMLHHVLMWIIWAFVIFHIYIGWHNDIVERNGLVSSIFSGYKFFGSGH